MKNVTKMTGSWNEVKRKLKQQFAILTDSDMLYLEGKQEEMLARLQAKLGKTKEEVKRILSELWSRTPWSRSGDQALRNQSFICTGMLRSGHAGYTRRAYSSETNTNKINMNLIQQFPDVSAEKRARAKPDNKRFKTANAKRSHPYREDDAVVKYYENKFRKWHIKVLFILVGTIAMTYYFILKGFWIFQWITS